MTQKAYNEDNQLLEDRQMSIQDLDIKTILWLLIFIQNIYTYFLFYTDKKRAVAHKRNRISEKRLLISSLLAGGVGAYISMQVNRHKTQHTKFKILIPIAALLTLLFVFLLWRSYY